MGVLLLLQVLEEYPEPTDLQSIVKVVCPRGNNLHEFSWPDGRTALCSMPSKFRNRVWIKRGDYMIVEPIEEGDKVAAEIVNILLPPQIRHLKVKNLWPQEFIPRDPRQESHAAAAAAAAAVGGSGSSVATADGTGAAGIDGTAGATAPVVEEMLASGSESEDDMSDLVANTNRRYFAEEPDETESEEEDEEP